MDPSLLGSSRLGAYSYRATPSSLWHHCRRYSIGPRALTSAHSLHGVGEHFGGGQSPRLYHSIPSPRRLYSSLDLIGECQVSKSQQEPLVMSGGNHRRNRPTVCGLGRHNELTLLPIYFHFDCEPESVLQRDTRGVRLQQRVRPPHFPEVGPSAIGDGYGDTVACPLPPPCPRHIGHQPSTFGMPQEPCY